MKNKTRTDVFFDNSVLKNILKKSGPSPVNFQIEFTKKMTSLGLLKPYFISTPIMLLEYIGQLPEPLVTRNPNCYSEVLEILKSEPFEANQIITDAIQLIKNDFLSLPVTDYTVLKAKIDHEDQFRHPYGIRLADLLFRENIKNSNTRERLVLELAIDEFQGVDLRQVYGELITDDRIARVLSSLAKFLPHDSFNVSIARTLHQFYLSAKQTEESVRSFKYNFKKDHQDRLDTQLVHFVCLGNKLEGRTNRVAAFTMEDPNRTKLRCKAYLDFLFHIKPTLKSLKLNLKVRPGMVYFLNKDGNVTVRLDVKDLWKKRSL
jgi:hypothetical protein